MANPRSLGLRIFSNLYWAFIVLTCPLFFLGAVAVFLLTLPFDRRRVALHLFSCAWATFYVAVNPLWRLQVTGREHLPWRGGAVIAANHASLIDIIVLFALFRPFKWVSKAAVFKVPVVGWNMRMNGYVPLVRGERTSIVAMMARCSALLRQGSPLLFFPEGTRTRDGELRAFKDGAFDLAMEHGVPLIPVAVHGTGAALPRSGYVLREHVDARVDVLPPLDPADFASVADLRDEARRAIAAALDARRAGVGRPGLEPGSDGL